MTPKRLERPGRLVRWLDSSVQNGQVDKDDFPTPAHISTLGFVVENTQEHITIAREDMGDGDYRGLVSIPRFAITEELDYWPGEPNDHLEEAPTDDYERLRVALMRIKNGSLGNFSAAMIAKEALDAT